MSKSKNFPKGEKWYELHKVEPIVAFGKTFPSLLALYETYEDEPWVQPKHFASFTRRMKEFDVTPELALYATTEELKHEHLELCIFDKELRKPHLISETLENTYFSSIAVKETALDLIRLLIESGNKKLPSYKRDTLIILRVVCTPSSYETIGKSYGITKERVRQIFLRRINSARIYLRKHRDKYIDCDEYLDNILEIRRCCKLRIKY